MKKIGIIGGAGPMAGAFLFETIISLYQEKGAKNDADFPRIILLNFPFTGLPNHSDPKKTERELAECFSILNPQVDTIAIACNTLHKFLKNDQPKLVHMIEETKLAVVGEAPLVICNEECIGLHQEFFDCVYPQKFSPQKLIMKILAGEHSKEDVLELVKNIQKEGVTKVVLGCTEFSYLNALYPMKGLDVIDPLKIVAEKVIRT